MRGTGWCSLQLCETMTAGQRGSKNTPLHPRKSLTPSGLVGWTPTWTTDMKSMPILWSEGSGARALGSLRDQHGSGRVLWEPSVLGLMEPSCPQASSTHSPRSQHSQRLGVRE